MTEKVIANLQVVVEGKNIKLVQKETEKLRKSTDKLAGSTDRAGKSRDRYNRREKGAAQISSNTTKNFSKMQQSIDGGGGAGGLVRAYALLAANVFALTAAFGVLSRSAQVDKLTESLEIFSVRGGQFVANIARDLQAASGQAINFADASRNVSLALSAGLDTSQIQNLTTVAKGASIALGRSLPDALDRIFRGVIKLEPEILDEIGLFVRVDEASQKYAQSLGKTVTSLTSVEKRQAFLTEATEQGLKKFEEFADTIETTAFDKLQASLIDIAQNLTSFVNKGLTPIVNFLAENRAILTGVFVAIAGTLLKLAIPAIGAFNTKLAESASLALADQQAYLKSVEQKSKASAKFAIQAEKDTIKASGRKVKGLKSKLPEKPFVSRAEGAKELETALKKNLKFENRQAVVNDKINQLVKAQAKAKGDNLKLIEQELKVYRAETKELDKQIAANNRIKQIRAKGDGEITGLAGKKLAQAESRVATTSALAQISGVGETRGVRAGFADLFETIKRGTVDTEEGTKSLTRMGKVSVGLKGSLGLLTTGVQSLMMTLGPWIAAFAFLAPLLGIVAQKLGFFSKEAKELDNTFKRTGDLLENLNKRFQAQTDGIKNSELSFLENMKAALAYNKAQTEVSNQILEINQKLESFNSTATDSVKKWEAFKKIFGLDRETKAIEQQFQLATEKIIAMFNAGDEQGLKVFGAALDPSGQLNKSIIELEKAEGAIKNVDKAVIDLVNSQQQAATTEAFQALGSAAIYAGAAPTIEDIVDRFKNLNGVTKEQIIEYLTLKNTLASAKAGFNSLDATTLNYVDASKADLELTKARTSRLANFTSAVEGAKDAVGKFTNSFLPKTKVDEVLSSLEQVQTSFQGLFEDIKLESGQVVQVLTDPATAKKFFENFEQDNPISRIFSDDEIKRIKDFGAAGNFKGASEIFSDIVEEFAKYQNSILVAKQNQKTLNSEIKIFEQSLGKGVKSNLFLTELGNKRIALAKSQKDVALAELQANLRAQKVDEARSQNIRDLVANAKSYKDIQSTLQNLGLSNQQLQSIAASFEAKRAAEIEEIVANRTLEQQKIIDNTKATQFLFNLEKDRLEISRKLVQNVAKVNRLRTTGSSSLDPAQEARISVQAAKDSLDITIQEANLKFAVLKAEQVILQKRLEVLAEEERKSAKAADDEMVRLGALLATETDEKKRLSLAQQILVEKNIATEKFASEQRIKTYASELGAVTDIYDEILRKTTANAANEFVVTLSDSIAKASKESVSAGLQAGSAAIKALESEAAQKGFEASAQQKREELQTKASEAAGRGDFEEAGRINEQMNSITAATEQAAAKQALAMTTARGVLENYKESFKDLGPEGVLAATILEGSMQIADAFQTMTTAIENSTDGLGKAAAVAEFASAAIGQISQIMAANSNAQISQIDKQIEAEKRRDGKSAESVAKIAAMEKKKEAIERKAFNQRKKMQMAQTIVNTASGMMRAYADYDGFTATALAVMIGALGAAQLAIISKQKYEGGSSEAPKANPTALTIGGRSKAVDVAKGATSEELNYLRGGRTTGQNLGGAGASFPGAAMGRRGYADGTEVVVGERGPEVAVFPGGTSIVPNYALGGQPTNVNFTINAVDGQSVQRMLQEQQGNIISMIRSAANENGETFLETVDTQVYGGGG